ncbi:MAG: zinc ribbon domain-containing protein [Burkholderiales bacterium]
MCSNCGWKNETLKLKDQEWTCQKCRTHHDRD